MGAVANGGPIAAISVCSTSAPSIATSLSTEGWTIGRTALKLRNQNNTPDAWERSVLAQFERRLTAGEPADALETHNIVPHDGRPTFRYMKAIVTAPQCLVCHGEALEPSLANALDELYPDDAARGFIAGSLRGAFTITKTL